MRRIVLFIVALFVVALSTQTSQAQWGRRYYRPVVVAPTPVMRVDRRPVMVYQPTTVVYTRNRPILGGTVVRTRPGYRRTVVW